LDEAEAQKGWAVGHAPHAAHQWPASTTLLLTVLGGFAWSV
jgi:hypothetical protein